MPTIVHFDISSDDINRARKFYENVFNWKISVMEGFSDYYEIATTDLQGKQGIGGGITRRQYQQQSGITEFIGVHSIDETITGVTHFGGKVLQPKQAIPGYGYLALCIDTENNVFGLFEDDKNAGAEMASVEETTNKHEAIKQHQTKL